ESLRVDGGMAQNAWFMQRQADFLGLPVLQASHSEATARGAAYLAGLRAGIWPDLNSLRKLERGFRRFEPGIDATERAKRLAHWHRAVQAVISFYTSETPGPA